MFKQVLGLRNSTLSVVSSSSSSKILYRSAATSINNSLFKYKQQSNQPQQYILSSQQHQQILRYFSTENNNNKNTTENNKNNNTVNKNDQKEESTSEESNNNNEQQQNQQNEHKYKQQRRSNKEYSEELKEKNKNLGMWVLASIIGVLGLSYAAVPLYRMFCRVTGYGGTVREASHDLEAEIKKRNLKRDLYPIKVSFTSSIGNKIPWTFKPVQSSIECIPGEPVLAFYRATNHTDKPIIGVATYNITPMKAGSYFTKIQCFCFDEQRIKPNETIDMPVLFVVEPEMLDDKNMKGITDITLSYTFFKSNDQGELEEI
ncbi:cytochrome c oxidase assembly protein [Cavenderia fasciculata]|uniref:Cytochrome c oxidase assembly protein n=1 Tax=Cavenderia fasciculata TaxID=261658 RepID=F4QEJ7_CACFS|nr:cytochrome c oxidase assembly protein [Cavenderia fasciculata]EGG14108.1 cytochrome c oxidase assembly protein [Cavenderia fasciculata]|eukprot:XP_004350816.1 cytochrome c oxidase assembly protein [Cavenderia fasciculata]